MTLVVAWAGVDQKKSGPSVASLYFTTDSRISWGSQIQYDRYTKTFGMNNHPDIFAFSGDVLFPTMILTQIIQEGDHNLLYPIQISPLDKAKKIQSEIEEGIKAYPMEKTSGNFNLLFGTRDLKSNFYCFKYSWNAKTGILEMTEIPMPKQSAIIWVSGSGKNEFDTNYMRYRSHAHNNQNTSRGVYHCFTETLQNIKDPHCGGAPQIVGLYRIRNAIRFGVIYNGKRFLAGRQQDYQDNLNFVEWRNELFERFDPEDIKILNGAQQQPRF